MVDDVPKVKSGRGPSGRNKKISIQNERKARKAVVNHAREERHQRDIKERQMVNGENEYHEGSNQSSNTEHGDGVDQIREREEQYR